MSVEIIVGTEEIPDRKPQPVPGMKGAGKKGAGKKSAGKKSAGGNGGNE